MVVSASTRALSGQAKVLVDHEFANARVSGSDDSEADDNSYNMVSTGAKRCWATSYIQHTKRDQLGRDLLELAEALGDGVTCVIVSMFNETSYIAILKTIR